jgi:hypothetical protein
LIPGSSSPIRSTFIIIIIIISSIYLSILPFQYSFFSCAIFIRFHSFFFGNYCLGSSCFRRWLCFLNFRFICFFLVIWLHRVCSAISFCFVILFV